MTWRKGGILPGRRNRSPETKTSVYQPSLPTNHELVSDLDLVPAGPVYIKAEKQSQYAFKLLWLLNSF